MHNSVMGCFDLRKEELPQCCLIIELGGNLLLRMGGLLDQCHTMHIKPYIDRGKLDFIHS